MRTPFNIQHLKFIILLAAVPLIAAPFSDNGDGTVTDQKTNLVWQKCSMGQNNVAACTGTATTATWAIALTYCNVLTLGGKTAGSWRLPNVNELKSIIDETKFNPAIDTASFPATVAIYYWSSSTYVGLTSSAWSVYFVAGGVGFNTKTNALYVRCVSGP